MGQGYRDFPMPLAQVVQARSWLADPRQGAMARVAASVLLLRASPSGIEVYAGNRAASMAFAGGVLAFPGGGYEPGDGGPSQTALRELAEETGVQLAGVGELSPLARWVTPGFEPRRFDTYFYTATVPTEQRPKLQSSEFTSSGWSRPQDLLSRATTGKIILMPPTRVLLEQVAASADVGQFVALRRDLSPIVAWPVEHSGLWWTRAPIDAAGAPTGAQMTQEMHGFNH